MVILDADGAADITIIEHGPNDPSALGLRGCPVVAVVECGFVLIGDVLHPVIQCGDNIALILKSPYTGFRRGLLVRQRQSRTTAQILHDIPPLSYGGKIPARRRRRDRDDRIEIDCRLESGIVVETAAIGTDMFAISVSADVVVVRCL